MSFRSVCILVLLLATPSSSGWAQDPSGPIEGSRPRTCLVLSGGGARGAAHVGALKVLERLRVPVDCIVGASVGSIVGSLYASGFSPQALESAFRTIDWEDIFDDSPSRRRISFRRKEDDLLSLLPLELGLGRKGISAPSGLIAAQKLSFVLRGLTLHTVALDHFDELRIPFRAVASDLSDGSMVVLDRGGLAEAVRASMAVPGLFTPVRRDGRTLVDAGVARNLPVDVARAMGAERVIAINIGTPPKEVEGDESLIEVVTQTLSVLSDQNVQESKRLLGPADVLVQPDLGDIDTVSFDRLVEAMERGEQAVWAEADLLRPFSVSEEDFARFLRRQRLPEEEILRSIVIDEVVVTGSKRVNERQITERIRIRPGTALELSDLREDLERVYQIGEFEQVEFRLEVEGERNRLVIDTLDKSWGPGYLRPGLSLSSDLGGESEFLALAVYRRTQLNRLGAEWKTFLAVGDFNVMNMEIFQPLDFKGLWFVSPYVELARDKFVDPGATAGEVEVNSYNFGLKAGVQIGNYAEITLGAETGRVEAASQLAGGFDVDRGGLRFSVAYDQLDNTQFPSAGGLGRLDFYRSLPSLGGQADYDRFELDFLQAWTRGRSTFLAHIRYGTSFDTEIPVVDQFVLGGLADLSGLEPGQLNGDSLVFSSLTYYRRFGWLYLGAGLEAGNVWQASEESDLGDLLTAGLVFAGRETFVGPLFLGFGATENGDRSFYFILGRLF